MIHKLGKSITRNNGNIKSARALTLKKKEKKKYLKESKCNLKDEEERGRARWEETEPLNRVQGPLRGFNSSRFRVPIRPLKQQA